MGWNSKRVKPGQRHLKQPTSKYLWICEYESPLQPHSISTFYRPPTKSSRNFASKSVVFSKKRYDFTVHVSRQLLARMTKVYPSLLMSTPSSWQKAIIFFIACKVRAISLLHQSKKSFTPCILSSPILSRSKKQLFAPICGTSESHFRQGRF